MFVCFSKVKFTAYFKRFSITIILGRGEVRGGEGSGRGKELKVPGNLLACCQFTIDSTFLTISAKLKKRGE